VNGNLAEFTRRALERGIDRREISRALAEAGWPPADIDAALRTFAAVEFPLPVPRPLRQVSAAEVFVYLVMFVSLATSATSLGGLFFEFIEQAFPDPLHVAYAGEADQIRANVRWHLSALIVSFPIFLFVFHNIGRAVRREPSRRQSWPRKWLTYGTLFIVVVCVVADVTTLVYYALGGELTPRFVLKILTVAVIAGGIFLFFLVEMRRDETA